MSLAVVGSRTFSNYDLLCTTLDKLRLVDPDVHTIVSGGARGADQMGERYAKEEGLETLIFEPDWAKHGKAAGLIRNKDIVAASDYVVAFWDGESRGTLNSINHAKQMKKELTIVRFKNEK